MQVQQKEYVLSRQLLRSGTAIGALIREAGFAQSRGDFISKMSISLKEANETEYWLRLTHDTDHLDSDAFNNLHSTCLELIAMLVASVRTAKKHRTSNP